jgi:hypothetical protein
MLRDVMWMAPEGGLKESRPLWSMPDSMWASICAVIRAAAAPGYTRSHKKPEDIFSTCCNRRGCGCEYLTMENAWR